MPIVTEAISPLAGATITVLVGVSRNRKKLLQKHNLPVPEAVPVLVEIDTGSALTGFMSWVFESLEVAPFDKIKVYTPSTPHSKPFVTGVCDVGLSLVSANVEVPFPSVYAIIADGFDKREGSVQGLIGRDILAKCVFIDNGPELTFTLNF